MCNIFGLTLKPYLGELFESYPWKWYSTVIKWTNHLEHWSFPSISISVGRHHRLCMLADYGKECIFTGTLWGAVLRSPHTRCTHPSKIPHLQSSTAVLICLFVCTCVGICTSVGVRVGMSVGVSMYKLGHEYIFIFMNRVHCKTKVLNFTQDQFVNVVPASRGN